MVLKVNRDELYDVTNVMKKDKDSYNQEVEKLQQNIETLKTIWQGEDSRVFCEKASEYFTKMKEISTTLDTLSEFCDKTNKGINDADEDFGKSLETEALENESN